ncbi:DUF2478 domain-containing protein [Rhodovulum strictum]|uniref:DUF2478 domain-containing protein n=1 Tax=Rhodovulum strictum TaxID=58314 RepID=A0A844BGZ9_9RHOB|nr:DUF2478 domain-containing protein [Rhodovulum strictum]
MKLAYTMLPGRGDAGLLFHQLAQELTGRGISVAGLVQTEAAGPDRHPCDMYLRVLPGGTVYRISQSLGAGSRGCRLDADALEAAAFEVGRALSRGTELLIVNKFGKLEAQGRGFRTVIAEAIGNDVPVIVGVNDLNLEAFLDFTDGLGSAVLPRHQALLDWVLPVLRAPVAGRSAWPPGPMLRAF